MKIIKMSLYFDYNSTTPLEPEVLEAICTTAEQCWKNPSSTYTEEAREKILESRKMLSLMLKTDPNDLIFTSGGTEANHSVYHTFANLKLTKPPHIITTNTEHPSVLVPLLKLQSDGRIELSIVPVSHKTGVAHFEDIAAALRPDQTVLVSVMLANNETGAISPIKQIVQGIRKWEKQQFPTNSLPLKRVFVHSDLAQAVGKLPIDVGALGLDYATVVGHKFYGPRIGCLFVRGLHTYGPERWEQMIGKMAAKGNMGDVVETSSPDAAPFLPLFHGGGQERGFRAGTENTPMIAGLGKAAELVLHQLNRYVPHMLAIRSHLEDSLYRAFPPNGLVSVCIFGLDRCSAVSTVSREIEFSDRLRQCNGRLPNTVNVAFIGPPWLNSADILSRCPQLEVSRGAACHSKDSQDQGSSVLRACGYTVDEARAAIRFSVGRHTTQEQVTMAVEALKKAVYELLQNT